MACRFCQAVVTFFLLKGLLSQVNTGTLELLEEGSLHLEHLKEGKDPSFESLPIVIQHPVQGKVLR